MLSAFVVLALLAGGCSTTCPAALLPGVVVAEGDELSIREEAGVLRPVLWPTGYSVRSDGERLVVSDLLGTVKGREGDFVELPGGEAFSDGPWRVCGAL